VTKSFLLTHSRLQVTQPHCCTASLLHSLTVAQPHCCMLLDSTILYLWLYFKLLLPIHYLFPPYFTA